MFHATFITSFRHLVVAGSIDGSIELLPGLNITNHRPIYERLLTDEFAAVAGDIEFNHFSEADNLVFGEYERPQLPDVPPDKFLIAIILWIDWLFKNAWLIRDHAMVCDAAFLRVQLPDGAISWTRNYLAARPTMADGAVDVPLELSVSALREWSQLSDEVETYLHQMDSSSLRFMMEKGFARTGRALTFVTAARRAENLAMKVANYCSAMETLFTTDSSELAHKLSERVAFFLGDLGHNKAEVFLTVKKAYSIRSKLVHGDTLSKGQLEELIPLCVACDQYLRASIRRIVKDESLRRDVFDYPSTERIEAYFMKRLLQDT